MRSSERYLSKVHTEKRVEDGIARTVMNDSQLPFPFLFPYHINKHLKNEDRHLHGQDSEKASCFFNSRLGRGESCRESADRETPQSSHEQTVCPILHR